MTITERRTHGLWGTYTDGCRCDACLRAGRRAPHRPNGDRRTGVERVPGSWADDAACRNHDTAMWFSSAIADIARARTICAGCPVRQQCADYAIEAEEPWGIWGGLDQHERDDRRRGIRAIRSLRGAS